MSSLLILGAGGHGKVAAETALASNLFSSIAFLDDYASSPLLGWPIIGPLEMALNPDLKHRYSFAFVAFGDPVIRLNWINILFNLGYLLPTLVHPNAHVSSTATIGAASIVMAQASVQTNTTIGRGAILNTSCSVDHDCVLSDGVHICPGAHLAGGVRVESRTCIGIGASVIPQVFIGSDVTVGAGSAVIANIPDSVTAVGVPARFLAT